MKSNEKSCRYTVITADCPMVNVDYVSQRRRLKSLSRDSFVGNFRAFL